MRNLSQAEDAYELEATQPGMALTLHELAQEGARQLLQRALRCEVQQHVERHRALRDDLGRAVVVRNGYAPARQVVLGTGPVDIVAPRFDDRGLAEAQRFQSRLLPRYARRAPEVTTLLPILYLRGLSSGDLREALAPLLGDDAAGLSASTVTRLTVTWTTEYEAFRTQRLDEQDFVSLWVDGVHLKPRRPTGVQPGGPGATPAKGPGRQSSQSGGPCPNYSRTVTESTSLPTVHKI